MTAESSGFSLGSLSCSPSRGYVELHCKSFYSFGLGASHVSELLGRAGSLGYPALALTDTNLCGGLEFARLAPASGVRPITGAELVLGPPGDNRDEPFSSSGSLSGSPSISLSGCRVVVLAVDRQGYGNLCRLLTRGGFNDRRQPWVSLNDLVECSQGLVLLTGGREGPLTRLLTAAGSGGGAGYAALHAQARALLSDWLDAFGPGGCYGCYGCYVELNLNRVEGDRGRCRGLVNLAQQVGAPLIATGDVHYHDSGRARLQQALLAAGRNQSLSALLRESPQLLRANDRFGLVSPAAMRRRFAELPEAVDNTLAVAERCRFDLAQDLGYQLPGCAVPAGFPDEQSYLEWLCLQAAGRRYGQALVEDPNSRVRLRLAEEFALLRQHGLAGFLLLYREIGLLARDIMVERGLAEPGVLLEDCLPGRGRGSSVCLLVGYLIGISHVDPLVWDLTLERFLSEDTASLPDIDLDFPRAIREELIERVHRVYGPERAALVGAVATHSIKGAVRAVGKALGLPAAELGRITQSLGHGDGPGVAASGGSEVSGAGVTLTSVQSEGLARSLDRSGVVVAGGKLEGQGGRGGMMNGLMAGGQASEVELLARQQLLAAGGVVPGFDDSAAWRHLLNLAPPLVGAPAGLGQHVGGLVLSDGDLAELVPVRPGAIQGRYIMDWNKDSVGDANLAKIDLLSLPVLDQLREALDLVEGRTGARPDLSQVDPADPAVYDLINSGRVKGVFLLQSPAQLKLGQRLKSRNLADIALQVALVRPGVGVQGSAVSRFVDRYRNGAEWDYDHVLEARALARSCGIIVWQEQVVQLLKDVAGFGPAEADSVRRAFGKANNAALLARCRERFLLGAQGNGVSIQAAVKVWEKLNGQYMFPESHSIAFGVTAYQAAWLKCYWPLEFFVALFNNQPMGFYPLETLKQDAKSFGLAFLNPEVNSSGVDCRPVGGGGEGGVDDCVDDCADDCADDCVDGDRSSAGSILLGLRFVKDVGASLAEQVVMERRAHGLYAGVADLVRRTGLKPVAVESLIYAGAFDGLEANRRRALWQAGLGFRPSRKGGRAFPGLGDGAGGSNGGAGGSGGSEPQLADFTAWERMAGEYRVLGLYPSGHLLGHLRSGLVARFGSELLSASAVFPLEEGVDVLVAGWPIARQHPTGAGGVYFITLEDETGDVQLVIRPEVYNRFRGQWRRTVLIVRGIVSRWDGTASVQVGWVRGWEPGVALPTGHDWH